MYRSVFGLSASKCTAYVFRTLRVSSLNDYEYIYVRSKSLARLGAPANGVRTVPKNIYCTLKLAYFILLSSHIP